MTAPNFTFRKTSIHLRQIRHMFLYQNIFLKLFRGKKWCLKCLKCLLSPFIYREANPS